MFGLTTILGLLIPLGTAAIGAYNKSKDVSIQAIQSSAAIVSAQAQYMTAVLGHPLSAPSIMCYGVAVWFFKATAIDMVFGHALGFEWSTPPLRGETAVIAGLVTAGMFSAGVVNQILKR